MLGAAAAKYIYNGQEYDSLDAVRAAMQGGAAPAPAQAAKEDTAGTLDRITRILDDHEVRDQLIGQLFNSYAGADGKLQPHELKGLANMLSVKIGVDASFFENTEAMFYRFDFDGDEQLGLAEAKKLIKFLLKEEKRLLNPREEETLTQLERKNLEQHFELGKKLGQGGQGAVYLATEKASGTKRVVKFYEKSGGNSCLDDIKDEFELLKRLDHPNMARICEVFEDLSNVYVISEPYTGGDLCTLVKKGQEAGVTITHQWLGLTFLQVVEGIAYLHSKQVMHCDLKEPNVMIADDKHWDAPHVVVIDFGMAKNFSGMRAGGTPGYMPPEFWQYNLWTPKGDMFALAVTFWSIYNCRQGGPFAVPTRGPPFSEIQQATCSMAMDCSRFPPGLREIMQKMSEKNFRTRPTAKQVQQMPYFRSLSEKEESAPIDPGLVNDMINASKRSDSQNMIAMELANSKNLGQMKEMNNLFRQLDADDDGTVESAEALKILQQTGISGAEAQNLVDTLIGSDGKIHYSEFMGRMVASTEALNASALASVFQSIDSDGSGSLSRAEVEQLMTHKNMGSLLEDRSSADLIQEMDCNGDGVVSFEEFKRAMLGNNAPAGAKGPSVGDSIEYYSASYGKWLLTEITAVDPRGSIQISVKPGAWLNREMQKNVRKAGGGRAGYA